MLLMPGQNWETDLKVGAFYLGSQPRKAHRDQLLKAARARKGAPLAATCWKWDCASFRAFRYGSSLRVA